MDVSGCMGSEYDCDGRSDGSRRAGSCDWRQCDGERNDERNDNRFRRQLLPSSQGRRCASSIFYGLQDPGGEGNRKRSAAYHAGVGQCAVAGSGSYRLRNDEEERPDGFGSIGERGPVAESSGVRSGSGIARPCSRCDGNEWFRSAG